MSSDPTTVSTESLLHSIHELQVTGIAFLTLTILSVAVRMFVRIKMIKKFGPEDWAMVATFMVTVAHIIVSITNCQLAIDIIKGDVSKYPLYNNLFRAAGATYVATLIFLKISLCFFFLHIFSHKRGFRIAIWGIMILSTILGVIYLPLGSFTCAQFKVFPGIVNTCAKGIQRSASVTFIMFSITNIVGDFVLAGLGCSALWGSKLPTPTKVLAVLLLLLGSCGGIASTIRLAIFLTPANLATYTQQTLALIRWILIELSFSVIAANLAMVRPLVHSLLVKMGFVTTTTGTTYGTAPRMTTGRAGTRNTDIEDLNDADVGPGGSKTGMTTIVVSET
ncbi:hypothetical protein K461DRAFT_267547 [Myriangium duriaei CBS 260.36]|uniref:Rhodopsin domain-containing protein n=1 Tax=Myriangium duriaei CBS 260.36 TaxID=1168546 RepID=A0A9P4MH69_9PEZI|nr:hypothetical protein K461DRAFT_267547 [Myriangium duriaei CBS 260.36]